MTSVIHLRDITLSPSLGNPLCSHTLIPL
ncbi:hypothetical protein CY0110_19627 [Crocosphaera chwakensis CCY0110]|uniref:Uncharacterized protein n=1 Tax=Crocosphaera chwakensis CCY0110 TaxID=391612 RepID=A3IJQ7_9CHRO|nr:hypothetical protein CY0110_19627 [Crocosphaera chwakensis CCY0110]